MKALLAFEAVFRCGGIAAAARDLGVTHGAVSKQVAALEDWLGRSLFDRDGNRLRVYDEAGALAAVASAFLDGIAREAGLLAGGRRPLRVLVQATFAMRWVIPRLPEFYRLYPHLDVHVKTRQTNDDWRAASFDVAVIRGDEAIRDWPAAPIMAETITLMGGPSLAAQVSSGPEALAGHTLLCSDSRPGELERWLAAAGLPPKGGRWRLQCFDHFYAALQAAINGQGFVAGPRPVLDQDVAAGLLAIPFPALTVPGPRHVAFHDPMDAGAADAQRFIGWLRTTIGTHPDAPAPSGGAQLHG